MTTSLKSVLRITHRPYNSRLFRYATCKLRTYSINNLTCCSLVFIFGHFLVQLHRVADDARPRFNESPDLRQQNGIASVLHLYVETEVGSTFVGPEQCH